MAINQLIAQGIRPIGADVPQIANMLAQRQQQQSQNALAQQGMEIDSANAGTSRINAMANMSRQQADMDEATRGQVANALDNLESIADPAQYSQAVAQYAAHPLAQKFGVDAAALDRANLPATRARLGVAPMKPRDGEPLETVDVNGVPTLLPRSQATGKQAFIKPASTTNVTVGAPAVENAAARAVGEAVGDAYSEVINQGRSAGETLDQLRSLKASPAVTGPGADSIASVTQLFASLGIPVSEGALTNAANVRQFGSMVGGVVLSKQLEQTGPQTDSDRAAIKDTLAKTSDVRTVRDAVIDYQIALAERKEMRAGFYDSYRQRTGKIDGAEAEWNKFKRETPLVTTNPKNNRLVFFHNFREAYQQGNPSATEEEIVQEWRGVSRGRK